jgi:hypothetical protein
VVVNPTTIRPRPLPPLDNKTLTKLNSYTVLWTISLLYVMTILDNQDLPIDATAILF